MAAINGLMVVEFLSSISFQSFSDGNSGVASVSTFFHMKLHIEKICYQTNLASTN